MLSSYVASNTLRDIVGSRLMPYRCSTLKESSMVFRVSLPVMRSRSPGGRSSARVSAGQFAFASVRLLSPDRLATLRETARRTVPPSTAWQLSEIVSRPLRNALSVDCERRTSFSATHGVGFGAGSPPGGLPEPRSAAPPG